MYVKLVNPQTRQVMTFECAGEAYHRGVGKMDLDEQKQWQKISEDQGYDARRFAIWEEAIRGKVEMTEIVIPAERGSPRQKGVSILTNWDAWLSNDHGRTIDRLHRHED